MAELTLETERDIYLMDLNEVRRINENLRVIRVPGGWVYLVNSAHGESAAFVPYDTEFIPS